MKVFDCCNLKQLILLYLKRNNMTNKELAEMLGISMSNYYGYTGQGKIPRRLNFQKHSDKMGLRYIVRGKEFRFDDYNKRMLALADEMGLKLRPLAESAGYIYDGRSLSVSTICDILGVMGLKIYVEEIKR